MNKAKTIRALVVDDSVVIRRLMSIALEKMGLEGDYVDNGVAALSSLQAKNYDIVFLDIMMPGMDGYQVCKLIKGDKATKDIPVIMLTGKDGAFDKIRGKMAGANHYLTKPVKMSEFTQTVENFLPIPDLERESATYNIKKNAGKTAEPEKVKPTPSSPAKLSAVPTSKSQDFGSTTQTVKTLSKAEAEPKEVLANKESNTPDPKSKDEMTREEKIAQIRKMMEK